MYTLRSSLNLIQSLLIIRIHDISLSCSCYFDYYYLLDSSDSDSSSSSDKSKDGSTISPPAPIPTQHNATATNTPTNNEVPNIGVPTDAELLARLPTNFKFSRKAVADESRRQSRLSEMRIQVLFNR